MTEEELRKVQIEELLEAHARWLDAVRRAGDLSSHIAQAESNLTRGRGLKVFTARLAELERESGQLHGEFLRLKDLAIRGLVAQPSEILWLQSEVARLTAFREEVIAIAKRMGWTQGERT